MYSADAGGSGGSPLSGSPIGGIFYQPLTVTAGKAAATWLVLAADPTQMETWTFTLLLVGAGTPDLNQIQVTGSLAPVSDVTIASASAPPKRFRDFGAAPAPPVPIVINTSSGCTVGGKVVAFCPPQAEVGPNVTTATATNKGTDPSPSATNVMIHDNVPSGETVTGCSASPGATCTQSGNQVTVSCGTLGPGQGCSATVTTQPDPTLQGGSVLDNTMSVLSDQPALDVFAATSGASVIALSGRRPRLRKRPHRARETRACSPFSIRIPPAMSTWTW